MSEPPATQDRSFAVALARALAGAVLFSLPLLMTMEMWQVAHEVEPLRLVLLLVLGLPLLGGLAWYVGFRDDFGWTDALLDALAAYLVGAVATVALLVLFGVIDRETGWHDALGMVAVQLVPAGFGATLARNQLAEGGRDERGVVGRESLPAELFLMAAGALFLALNIAPTDEVGVIGRKLTPWHALALVAVTVVGMHALVYGLRLRGQHGRREGVSFAAEFATFTLAGYGVALVVSALVLWILGQLDGLELLPAVHMLVVLGLPAGIGAAIARVVL